jgi:hypothetical protein
MAGRINLDTQSGGNPAFHGKESKKSSQRTDIVLEACSAQAFAGFGDVGFDMLNMDILQGSSCFLQVLEKALRRIPVV